MLYNLAKSRERSNAMPKHNNRSKFFRNWTTQKLKKEATALHSAIYADDCFGTKDLICFEGIRRVLETRGIKIIEQPTIHFSK